MTPAMHRSSTLLLTQPLAALALLLPLLAQTPSLDLPLLRASGFPFIELSPLLIAANGSYPGRITMDAGGIPLIVSGRVDVATNAETQLLRQSVDNPDLRMIFTVAECYYRIVAKRSAGIRTLTDLKGKRVAVPPNTSAHYYLVKMLAAQKLTEADITIVATPSDQAVQALAESRSDAIVAYEPEPERARQRLGSDAVILQNKRVYRELFNLNTTAKVLADPASWE